MQTITPKIFAICSALYVLFAAPFINAATITVTSSPSGFGCTLVSAINSANADSALDGCLSSSVGIFGDDTIIIPASLATHTLTQVNNSNVFGANALPQITSNITIEGNGALIERSALPSVPDFRFFYISTGASLTLRDVTLSNAKESGAGIFIYGGSAEIENVTVSDNDATGSLSGAITSSAVGSFDTNVTISNSTISDNTGNGIFFTRSGTTSGNLSLRISDSVISNNTQSGITTAIGTTRIDRSEISFNQRGAINTGNDVVVSVRDSTISNNQNTLTNSGGINVAVGGTGSAQITLLNNTIVGNTGLRGGGIFLGLGTLNLINNIIAGNSSTGVGDEIAVTAVSGLASPTIGRQASNLIGESSKTNAQAVSGYTSSSSDIFATSDGTAPTALSGIVGSLQNNGGKTRTHALVNGSPALDSAAEFVIDRNSPFFLFYEGCSIRFTFPSLTQTFRDDQRGMARPQSGRCDIGAFEKQESHFYVIPLKNGGAVVVDL